MSWAEETSKEIMDKHFPKLMKRQQTRPPTVPENPKLGEYKPLQTPKQKTSARSEFPPASGSPGNELSFLTK